MKDRLLDAQGITVRFDGLLAVDDVDLALPEGEIHGLIGPNGAGKTTFFNAVSGLVPLSGGRLMFGGTDITGLPAHHRAAAGMRRTFQAVQLVPQFTVLENVLVGLHTGLASGVRLRERDAQQAVVQTLEYLGLRPILLRTTRELSFVEQRYVELARTLVSRPKLLMLDEPAAGLSPGDVDRLDTLLRRLRDEQGLTILLVEHVLSLVMGVCDRITVLENGRRISHGTAAAVAKDPVVQAAYLGTEHA